MVVASQLMPGMTIAIGKKIYKVEQAIKVSGASKTAPFTKVKMQDLDSQEVIEKTFKPTQELDEVSLEEHRLEFLYVEGDFCIFLDTNTLELVQVPYAVAGSKLNYLKEGIEVKALCYKNIAFSIVLPQFLELMVSSIESRGDSKIATLETGAKIEIPLFIDIGDIIKVDPDLEEYIQRV